MAVHLKIVWTQFVVSLIVLYRTSLYEIKKVPTCEDTNDEAGTVVLFLVINGDSVMSLVFSLYGCEQEECLACKVLFVCVRCYSCSFYSFSVCKWRSLFVLLSLC